MKPLRFPAAVAAVLFLSVALAADKSAALPESEARARIIELRSEIARHDELYHRKAAPEISDADYDQLKRRLAELERRFPAAAEALPPRQEIGDDRSGLFQTHRHREPMLSLEKAYNEADVRAFHARIAKLVGHAAIDYVIEPKFDGLAVSVTFENGKLVRAVTRGNGTEGDDITANAVQIDGFPRALRGDPVPRTIELRGEIYVTFAEFERVNAEREAAGEVRFANPRALAAGTIRQLDARQVGRRGLRVVFYAVGHCEPVSSLPATQSALHQQIAAWGLPGVPKPWSARDEASLLRAIETVGRERDAFDFPTDGAVVKVDSLAHQREAGATEHAPRWALAYKFAPERAETQLVAITLQVGRTGVVTPVAELAPITLGGSTIARATLHNRDEIARKDLRVGDFVYVEKAGEIIPAIVGVNLARRPAAAAPFAFPRECPACRAELVHRDGEAAVRCPNLACAGQLRRRLEHWASKTCVDIEGLGPAMIETLVAKGWVKDLPGLYSLRRDDLLRLGKNNARSVDRLLAAIEASKRAELWRVIHGLGLPQVGAAAAKDLARQHGTLAALADAQTEPRVRELARALLAAGVTPAKIASAAATLSGKTFVLTGTLPGLTRAQATEKIEAAGGKVAGSVSKSTHYVVAGAEAGAKLEHAKKLGIAIIDEAELRRMLDER